MMEDNMFKYIRCLWFGLTFLAALPFIPLNSSANGPAPRRSEGVFEVRFLNEMIDHHSMAVAMASLCEGRTIHSELQQLCDSIVTSQSAEIGEMQTWLQNWYGIQHVPEMNPKDERELEMLASLSGPEFEIMFMEMMMRHHSIAIRRAMDCVRKAYHQELVNLCENNIATQTEEIDTMQGWLCQWYEICK